MAAPPSRLPGRQGLRSRPTSMYEVPSEHMKRLQQIGEGGNMPPSDAGSTSKMSKRKSMCWERHSHENTVPRMRLPTVLVSEIANLCALHFQVCCHLSRANLRKTRGLRLLPYRRMREVVTPAGQCHRRLGPADSVPFVRRAEQRLRIPGPPQKKVLRGLLPLRSPVLRINLRQGLNLV